MTLLVLRHSRFGLIIILGAFFCLQLAAARQPRRSSGSDDGDDHYCHPRDATADTLKSVDGSGCMSTQAKQTKSPDFNGKKWKWDPTSKSHPCNIRRISHTELLRRYGEGGVPNLYPYPLVIYADDNGGNDNGKSKFVNLTTLDNLPSNFPPNFHVTLTGSDSLSSHRRTVPLTQYLREVLAANGGSGETLPNQLGNETWYLFGETFSEEWAEFLERYELPTCQSCTPLHREQNKIALSFGVGNIGSGVQWHLHGPGFSETIHGRKHWVLYPPEDRPEYDLDYASRHWMENTYPALEDWGDEDLRMEKKNHEEFLRSWNERTASNRRRAVGQMSGEEAERGPSSKKPWECTINRGEMIYFPDQWHHATINLEKYTVFVSSFTTEHEG
eukprot:CAMPEP_0172532316 /NCGR_PEP_ID=MMETSP1067-20121228/5416_1 /TAXON_ID=265564 ORGANISM="Thalassiosira punctigera, Strain Tpunct2005C2" /NCGR_SAMPLE_ID=MMETSP1067 /ASSEMBLY_ACC=CAM_ASM_000444 /LENGTH=386 /DNA_ID=CAMNT_0013316821 /DNA_START=72 /DNA_END=1232 /DNA_ORIENTATION=-